ncbi:trypsin-like serine protease [Pedobacter rhodius]|uniref:Trypsin-like serine protease n=1 Tax=Pedobacter rhodius TaxID=3004098 RepID=A0ABT4KVP6_9SPHI|nr:trypsin-like serine protease [Pedobacter sp. SJ11]MCZ4222914.1 trypsin-like serine protease [Pedobacter sp. SJ11]
MKTNKIFNTLAVFSFCLFCCGISRHDADPAGLKELASAKQFNCVGKAIENGKSIGSGVLISSRYVLSAAHVLMTANQMFTKKRKIDQLEPADFAFDFNGNTYQVKKITVHPDAGLQGVASGTDLMLLELEKAVPDVDFPALNTKFDELGSQVTGVGFGVSGIVSAKGSLKNEIHGVKSAGKNVVDKFSGMEINGKPSLLQLDFDSPDNPSVSKMGSDKPIAFEYTPAGGDSGGGLFRMVNGKPELVGILHSTESDMENFRKNGYYGEVSNWTRVSIFTGWIKKTISVN